MIYKELTFFRGLIRPTIFTCIRGRLGLYKSIHFLSFIIVPSFLKLVDKLNFFGCQILQSNKLFSRVTFSFISHKLERNVYIKIRHIKKYGRLGNMYLLILYNVTTLQFGQPMLITNKISMY